MEPAFYRALMDGAAAERDGFDTHVLACILTIGMAEAPVPLTEAVGLDPRELATLLTVSFPDARVDIPDIRVARPADEECLAILLTQAAGTGLAARWLAPMIARRAQRPDHLWQDLGLRTRGELSRLMLHHFHSLASRNTRDMKWKKFLYRSVCADAGFSLCTAPSCAECDDFEVCFGDESGESFLARSRRDAETAR